MIPYEQQLDYAKIFGESLFYGAECVLMIVVVHIQLTSRHLLPTHKIFLVAADVMFLLATAHISLLLYECFTGTIPPRVLQAAVVSAHLLIAMGDSVLIWRVWVVWNRSFRVIILPMLALLAGLVVGLTSAAEAVSYSALSKILPVPTVILGVVNTTLCTALIAGRLAYLDHVINGHLAFGSGRRHPYRGVILLIVESGTVLTCANIISVILERLHHPGLHVMLNIYTPLACIVPTAIIVLSYLQLVPGDTANATTTVCFATQLGDSALPAAGAARHARAATSEDSPRYGCNLTMARSGTSLEFSPDVEKQLRSLGATTSAAPSGL